MNTIQMETQRDDQEQPKGFSMTFSQWQTRPFHKN